MYKIAYWSLSDTNADVRIWCRSSLWRFDTVLMKIKKNFKTSQPLKDCFMLVFYVRKGSEVTVECFCTVELGHFSVDFSREQCGLLFTFTNLSLP